MPENTDLRRSQRVLARPGKRPASEADAAQPAAKRPRKRAKKSAQRMRFMDLPIDIIELILFDVEPYDLLRLSMCNKAFRSMLAAESAAPIWTRARANAGLPGRPPFMTEVQFANLAYAPYCHVCSEPGVVEVEWELGARYCQECSRKWNESNEYTDYSQTLQHPLVVENWYRIWDCSPNWTCLQYRMAPFARLYEEMLDVLRNSDGERESVVVSKLRTIVETRKKHMGEMKQFRETMERWARKMQEQRNQFIRDWAGRRWDQVCDRLRELGFERELGDVPFHRALVRFPWIRSEKCKPLSDGEWRKMRKSVIRTFESLKAERIAKENEATAAKRLIVLRSVLDTVQLKEGWDCYMLDIVSLKRIQDILDVPMNACVTTEDFLGLDVQALADEMRAARQSLLVAEIVKAIDYEVNFHGLDPFELARTSIACKSCCTVLRRPQALSHNCQRFPVALSTHDDALSRATKTKYGYPWSLKLLDVRRSVKKMDELLTACGKDPFVTTHEDMKQLATKVACTRCRSRSRIPIEAMLFDVAVEHAMFSHRRHDEIKWVLEP